MIRLVAIRQWVKINGISNETLRLIAGNSQDRKDLFKACGGAVPREALEELYVAQRNSGISTKLINEGLARAVGFTPEPIGQMRMSRARRRYELPEATLRTPEFCTRPFNELVTLSRNFWNSFIEPMQLDDYFDDVRQFKTYEKLLIIRIKLKQSEAGLICFQTYMQDERMVEFIKLCQSYPKPRFGDLAYTRTNADMTSTFKCTFSKSWKNRTLQPYDKHEDWSSIPKFIEDYEREIHILFMFIWKCNAQGIINSALMEGAYEDFYRERCLLQSTGEVEQYTTF